MRKYGPPAKHVLETDDSHRQNDEDYCEGPGDRYPYAPTFLATLLVREQHLRIAQLHTLGSFEVCGTSAARYSSGERAGTAVSTEALAHGVDLFRAGTTCPTIETSKEKKHILRK